MFGRKAAEIEQRKRLNVDQDDRITSFQAEVKRLSGNLVSMTKFYVEQSSRAERLALSERKSVV